MHRATPDVTAIRDTTEVSDQLAYSVGQAAKRVGISERRLWDRVRDGRVKSYMDGGRRLISRRALEAYVDELEAASTIEAA